MPTPHLFLDADDAHRIQDGKPTRLLFPISTEALTIAHIAPGKPFPLRRGTEGCFPVHARVSQLPEAPAGQPWALGPVTTAGWAEVFNGGVLCNFAGDATHDSTLIQTPYGLSIGQDVVIENRYNVPPTKAKVLDLEMLKPQGYTTWFWLLTLQPHVAQSSAT